MASLSFSNSVSASSSSGLSSNCDCHLEAYIRELDDNTKNMAVKPTVALRAALVGGIAAFAKIAGAMKAAGGVKLGAATADMTAAATAALAGSKQEQTDASKHPSN